MTSLHTFASGSEGNCLLVSCGSTHLLVDAGISTRRIKTSLAQLGLSMDDIAAIFLTHDHTDHVCGLATLCKHHQTPLYASEGTATQLIWRLNLPSGRISTVRAGETLALGHCRVQVFPTSHDAHESVDYRIDSAEGSIGVLTDTGIVTDEAFDALCGVDLLVLESNHDVEWLQSGPYPYQLKQRILGARGHLSNDDAARFAAEMVRRGTKEIVLAHLSRENNTPARALDTTVQMLGIHGLTARVSVAPRSAVSQCYRPEGFACRK